jgi:multidrug efflux pump subunit AcrB/ABC-type multidrug transport system ATPase subunit
MSLHTLPVRRPVATAMLFVGIFLLGLVAWWRIPVELMPPVQGDELYASFVRPGSDPEIVEREILLPLEARIGELPRVDETWSEIRGSSGSLTVRFEPGTELKVREIDLRRLASELVRTQPRGTAIEVSTLDLSELSQFVLFAQVTGGTDRDSLLDFVEERVVPRLLAVPGVSRVIAGGGAPREMTVRIDPDRCAAHGVQPEEVVQALARSVRRLKFLGGLEDEAGRTAVILDGRPRGPVSLGDLRVRPDRPVLLRHVADVGFGTGREERLFRVNGKPTVALVVFQDEGANLVRLGKNLRHRLDELRAEFQDYGLGFVVNFDSAKLVEDQLDRLAALAGSGFAVSLLALYLFLRQWRAVVVVAVSVPASLLAALALLHLGGQSLNLITLFGLAVAIGMLIDNSIVVYEAVQQKLEHGASLDGAVEQGLRRTLRAILAASVANTVVFIPILFADFEQSVVRSLLKVLALAISLPLLASVVVAIGLVPLLARRFAAPAALARIGELRQRRVRYRGVVEPDRARGLFGGLLVAVLRRPGAWLAGTAFVVFVTLVATTFWLSSAGTAQEAPEAETVRLDVQVESGGSLEVATSAFRRLEDAAQRIGGVEIVESMVGEDGGALTVHLPPKERRPAGVNAASVREVVRGEAAGIQGVTIDPPRSGGRGNGGGNGGGGGMAALLGQAAPEIVLSGPEAEPLDALARDVAEVVESIPGVESALPSTDRGLDEIRVAPDAIALATFGLTPDQILPSLGIVRREGVVLPTGFTQTDGREIPLMVRRVESGKREIEELTRLRVSTASGVLPLTALADVRKMPAPAVIRHHDGRRETTVTYRLEAEVARSAPSRQAVEERIREVVAGLHRPTGTTVEAPDPESTFSWFRKILIPVVLILYAVLAITFESLTLPALILLSLPLTLIGATWALVLTGTPPDTMALVGALALIGLTVNPAILLVDRMQQRAWYGGLGAGAAALAAVRERTRPILMSTTTAVVGLWPLSLVTGAENEIWPPFATIVMGGLVTSTVLTLLLIPVGFVFLHRLDRLFGRLGPWVVMGWGLATAVVVAPLIATGVLGSLTWQVVTTLLVAAALLGLAVLVIWRDEVPEPKSAEGPPAIEVRYLEKVYGRPGPIGRAWRAPVRFAERVLALGGEPFDPRRARDRIIPIAIVIAGAVYLVRTVGTMFWRIGFTFVVAALVSWLLREARRARGKTEPNGTVLPGGPENAAAAMTPWAALAYIGFTMYAMPHAAGEPDELAAPVIAILVGLVALLQGGRHTARQVARGAIPDRGAAGPLRRARTVWRRASRAVLGFDLPQREVRALAGVHFRADRGMIGILGPNGAGKTTLLRNLAGILDPSTGAIWVGGVRLGRLRRHLARWVGYLPQEFGLPDDLTAREYLEYYALHYKLYPSSKRKERVERLLGEVGLGERAGERIGSYSGGMRQRVAVARTLLRLPPLIIVDEPTVGLDPRERIRFRNLLSRLAEGRIVLFSTHVVEDVEVACERVIVLARGRIVFDGQPADLAHAAQGRVWVARLGAAEQEALPPRALVVDHVPEVDGTSRLRILHAEAPTPSAEAADPSLQDGYLWLVGGAVS